MLQLLINIKFSDLFTPLLGSFQTFPHGTYSLSVFKLYLPLDGGPPYSKKISRVSFYSYLSFLFSYWTFTIFGFQIFIFINLGFSIFAHHYSQNLIWFLFLILLRCFNSYGFLFIFKFPCICYSIFKYFFTFVLLTFRFFTTFYLNPSHPFNAFFIFLYSFFFFIYIYTTLYLLLLEDICSSDYNKLIFYSKVI